MRCRTLKIIATVALVICLVCPILEIFDDWDHTMQTGNDSEYALVVLALCVGVAYSFARFIFKYARLWLIVNSIFASCTQKAFRSAVCDSLFDATSPPLLALRI